MSSLRAHANAGFLFSFRGFILIDDADCGPSISRLQVLHVANDLSALAALFV